MIDLELMREKIENLIEKLEKYDIISFDIFDTLILRPFDNPATLFHFMACHYNILDFYKVRIQASKTARDKKELEEGHREVTLEEIYQVLEKKYNIDAKKGAEIEFQYEKKFCYANPYMKEIFSILLKKKKRIIIISDMYYNTHQIEELLQKSGYLGYENLFVSCDYKKSKKEGTLFKTVRERYPKERIIHIGDNENDDIINSSKYGFESYYYPKCNLFAKELNNVTISSFLKSIYLGIVKNKFYNGYLDNPNKYYYYGYTYGGLFVLGYANWIYKYVKQNNIEKVLFLSRDGYILNKLFSKFYNDIDSSYFYWSRHASICNAMERDLEYFYFQFIDRIKRNYPQLTIEQLLKKIELTEYSELLCKYELNSKEKISGENVIEKLKYMIEENIEILRKISQKNSNITKQILKPLINDKKKIAIVDIGWRGSGIISLKYLIEEKWKMQCEVTGLLAGTHYSKPNFSPVLFQKGILNAYMFSMLHNRNLTQYHEKEVELKNTIIEILISAPHSSFLKYSLQNNKVVSIFENEDKTNILLTKEIQKGEMDFVNDYLQIMGRDSFACNIAGADAYAPIKILSSEESLLKAFVNDFSQYHFNITALKMNEKEPETFSYRYKEIKKKSQKNQKIYKKIIKKIKRYLSKIKKKLKKIRNKNGK